MTANLAAALSAGASLREAMELAMAAASIGLNFHVARARRVRDAQPEGLFL